MLLRQPPPPVSVVGISRKPAVICCMRWLFWPVSVVGISRKPPGGHACLSAVMPASRRDQNEGVDDDVEVGVDASVRGGGGSIAAWIEVLSVNHLTLTGQALQ